MCLYTKANAVPQVAKKNIVCYKLMIRDSRYSADKGCYCTPCQYEHVSNDITDGKINFEARGMEEVRMMRKFSYEGTLEALVKTFTEVGGGFIHTFMTRAQAEKYAERWVDVYPPRKIFPRVIFKCIIPKGTYYYQGNIDEIKGADNCYASSKIRFVEKVNEIK